MPALNQRERQLVMEEVLYWHDRAWTVHAVSVMPDHVHLLATPLEASPGYWYSLLEIMGRVKGRSAYGVNRERRRRGHLWLEESYDRIIRGTSDFEEKFRYIRSNAGVEGIVGPLEEYAHFWCEGMQCLPQVDQAAARRPLQPRPPAPPARDLTLSKRTRPGVLVKTRRRLPHWQLAGSTYFVQFGLR